MTETQFRISISDERIEQLRQKLALTVFPDELEDAGWEYGLPLVDTQRLIARWKDGYDWKKHESQLNQELPQFTRDIDVEGHGNLNIHYVHKKSDVVDAIPLLFVHGCKFLYIQFPSNRCSQYYCFIRARQLYRSSQNSSSTYSRI